MYVPVTTDQNSWRVPWVGFLVSSPWLAGHCEPGWFVFSPERRRCLQQATLPKLCIYETYAIVQLILNLNQGKKKDKKKLRRVDARLIHSSILVVFTMAAMEYGYSYMEWARSYSEYCTYLPLDTEYNNSLHRACTFVNNSICDITQVPGMLWLLF